MERKKSWRIPKRRLFSYPIPDETRTYKPVSHKELADATITAIKDAGFTLGVEEYYSIKNGDIATARYTITDIKDEDMQLEIGWQNSYNKSVTLKFAIGTRIMICENGCVSGNFGSFARKHMADVQTFAPEEMKNLILDAAKAFDSIVEDKNTMKKHIIGRERQYELIGKLYFVNSFIGPTELKLIYNEFKDLTYDYKAPETIWETYQLVTFAIKELHPRLWMDAHISIHNFFLKEIDNNVHRLKIEEDAIKWKDLLDDSSSDKEILAIEVNESDYEIIKE